MTQVPTGIARFHATQRSRAAVLGLLALMTVFIALLFVPGVTSLLKVQRDTTIWVVVAWLVCTAAAGVAYRVTGLSRLYVVLDFVESLSMQAGLGLLIYRSGGATSIFWLAYFCHTQLMAGYGFVRRHLAVVMTGPAALVVMFSYDRDRSSALLSLLIGALGTYSFSVLARVQSSLEASLAREAELKNSLASLRVAEERSRIARDLHDGVAGELTALAWRLRQLPLRSRDNTLDHAETEAIHLEERVRSALGNLRNVVLDLRQEPQTWVDTIAVLRERCRDLCGNRRLLFNVTGPLDDSVPERICADIEYIVSELVRNATTHAQPNQIEVLIHIGDPIQLSVADDGRGIPADFPNRSSGGLANLQRRVKQLHGQLEIEHANPGTHIHIRLPSPSHGHGMGKSQPGT